MNFTKSTRIRKKFVTFPYVTDGYCVGATINLLLDVDQDSDQEMADVLRLRDQLTEILESVMPGSQHPFPDGEIPELTASLLRYHKVRSIAYPDAGDGGFTSV